MQPATDTKMPLIGDPFPTMKVATTQGEICLPGQYRGKWFVLFSHPGDFTPVCTTEFVDFARRRADFRRLNTELIGLSVDQVFAHLKWIQWIERNLGTKIWFPVIGDQTGIIAHRLGLIHPNKGANTVRAVFVVDANGVIRAIIYYPQETGRNICEIMRLIRALQVTDEFGVSTPANWPDNSIIDDHVIIPPAKTEKEAKERLAQAAHGGIECFDWWFCHYDLDADCEEEEDPV
ncbi:MAG TPA: peroxiredoxin [Methylomusa anaerophila]|uniref:Peroxiredoxin n=1 Tax=Methylomusa anaerophila TaxID=1930071 RepID=A0A348ALM2_9FIRM|nr:peroxiredoxin [Methylomusa anaerophila]BBB91970.1 selenocysteine-containing peroxiredoxin PrxU [Methylomusa anaerophila]HML88018.1 peroxiredoxin [Methylomusa anaerophila]